MIMHEMSIAVSIVEIVTEQLGDYPDGRVSSVNVRIGEASGVDPGQLRFAFPVAAEGSALDGTDIVIDIVPLTFRCRACSHAPMDPGSAACPRCGSGDIELAAGTELEIASFELLSPDEVTSPEQ